MLLVYGTRPEAIKMAPVVRALAADGRIDPVVCTTAQHREMVDQVHRLFDIVPDVDLDLMRPDQQLNDLTARTVTAVDAVIERVEPSWLVVQGDTTTAMAAALAAFHRQVPVAHVEAGLRTGDLGHPFPEEANRRLVDVVSARCFAPTAGAAVALAAEGIASDRVLVTGNTVVDALAVVRADVGEVARGDEVLVTLHRRESHGAPLVGMLEAVATLAHRFPAHRFVVPVHPNPNVAGPVRRILGDVPNVELTEPLDHPELVRRLLASRLVLTDSGGIQEEAPSLATPVLVARRTTERPEAVAAGTARLVGTDPGAIVDAVTELLTDDAARAAMVSEVNPFGDGRAARRIAASLGGETVEPWQPPPPGAPTTRAREAT